METEAKNSKKTDSIQKSPGGERARKRFPVGK